jgi:hypothetical protein
MNFENTNETTPISFDYKGKHYEGHFHRALSFNRNPV